ncbi:hypothetical protein [Sedimentitalea todarodis]|uniref:Uncharacterized protein n=1 Tax=Sedimentitalea todarodis TaxID=1631240 RepID=A0ABU3VHV9_9RHOB|nr:hypothetical protein [Sedimentitalea todarodis]MDU9005782.1 hypothetical protein [Sedimentitalea todarodis]
MRKFTIILSAIAMIAGAASAAETSAPETYDLLFKNGTLDGFTQKQQLIYDRKVQNSIKPETADRDTGKIVISFADGQVPEALLKFTQGDKYRNLGAFPSSVGNPMIMYFVETVVRDMAESAGGSPFYIRNRVKEALIKPSEISNGQAIIAGEAVETVDVTMRPFKDDPNADRMQGFDNLALTVSMSDDAPGWYLVLSAHVPGTDAGDPVYSSIMTFDRTETTE